MCEQVADHRVWEALGRLTSMVGDLDMKGTLANREDGDEKDTKSNADEVPLTGGTYYMEVKETGDSSSSSGSSSSSSSSSSSNNSQQDSDGSSSDEEDAVVAVKCLPKVLPRRNKDQHAIGHNRGMSEGRRRRG